MFGFKINSMFIKAQSHTQTFYGCEAKHKLEAN